MAWTCAAGVDRAVIAYGSAMNRSDHTDLSRATLAMKETAWQRRFHIPAAIRSGPTTICWSFDSL